MSFYRADRTKNIAAFDNSVFCNYLGLLLNASLSSFVTKLEKSWEMESLNYETKVCISTVGTQLCLWKSCNSKHKCFWTLGEVSARFHSDCSNCLATLSAFPLRKFSSKVTSGECYGYFLGAFFLETWKYKDVVFSKWNMKGLFAS